MVGNGNPMGVTTQVVKDLLWTAERFFGIHDPPGLAAFSEQGFKPSWIREGFEFP